MLTFVVRRVAAAAVVLLAINVITFLLMHATAGSYIPGLENNPALRPEDLERLKSYLGLDRPLHVQFGSWLSMVIRGDFGRSMVDGAPVAELVLERLPSTLLLTLTALGVGVIAAVPIGVFAALHRGTLADNLLTVAAVAGYAIPPFWLGLAMILLFSVSMRQWGLPSLPSGGVTSIVGGGDLADRLAHLVMPTLVLSFAHISVMSRFVRSSMLEVLAEDYVRTARAKGLGERTINYTHTFRNAALPLITLIGLDVPVLVSGAVVTEVIFSWPGVGQLLYQRALQSDYTVVMGITTMVGAFVVLGSLLADLAYAWLDPRIRFR